MKGMMVGGRTVRCVGKRFVASRSSMVGVAIAILSYHRNHAACEQQPERRGEKHLGC
jgi:hypothetical protein